MSKRKAITDDLGVVSSQEGNYAFYAKQDYWQDRYKVRTI